MITRLKNSSRRNVAQTIVYAMLLSFVMACYAIGDEYELTVEVVDAENQQPLAARLYLRSSTGDWHYFTATDKRASAVRYEKQNWINKRSIEYHTTVSAHPVSTRVPAGDYQLTVEKGKSYLPQTVDLAIESDGKATIGLTRWNNPAKRGWFSGDTHLHREIDDLRNVIVAEDLNVALPLTNWVTRSDRAPAAGDKNIADIPGGLIRVDDRHVIWPRNTEYEIFSVGSRRHTLGALFVLGHRDGLDLGVPDWKPVVESVRVSDPHALFDMDKLDWPFALLLPTIAPDALYELANNHVWRTEFAFRKWNTPAPAYLQPPFGAAEGGHRRWLDYTMGMYYTLLNAGLRMPPSAGTANGVHPVPAGFGRVYVHLPDGFEFGAWMEGLKRGRSFVTTGPMLYATASRQDPGHVFSFAEPTDVHLEMELVSETPLAYGEILVNGRPEFLLRPENRRTSEGAFRSMIDHIITPRRSGWIAVRFWEPRLDGQSRFVHSAPWYVEMAGRPVRMRPEEKRYLTGRIQNEMQRSTGIVSESAMLEYERALTFYQSLPVVEDGAKNSRPLTPDSRSGWLDNMIVHHRYAPEEIRAATGMSLKQAEQEIADRKDVAQPRGLRVLPYPGGRHPRIGFLDGAIRPQRETKISIFPPWQDCGYVVVDVPEAIFSTLGLTYLAHTHIPTIWDEQNKPLAKQEWEPIATGYKATRELPNGIRFVSEVSPTESGVRMMLTLTNGTSKTLTGLRVQVCTMLKGAVGFNVQEKLDSVTSTPFLAVGSKGAERGSAQRWIITAWQPNHRVWTNPPVPCVHSDPVFPDCPPGETVSVSGGLWFYEGEAIEKEIDRLRIATMDNH